MQKRHSLIIALCLVLMVAAAFGRVATHDFLNYDDDLYITANKTVLQGLTWSGVDWAFRSTHAVNWHPLTWISHMLDVQLFGMEPGAHHLVSVVLHAANAVLIFLVLRGMTGALFRSAAVAALFAVHPLHVESVAWLAERKDLLSTLFLFLTLGAYLRYVRRPSILRYLPVVLLFALGLMSKPMLVTLPFVLLLLDYWPLGRVARGQAPAPALAPPAPEPHPPSRLLLEKIPLLALSLAISALTFYVQTMKVAPTEIPELPIRIANALVSYAAYLGKTVWPVNLSVFYPYPMDGPPLWKLALSGAVLAAGTVMAVLHATRRPSLIVGWLWYLGTLVPVIGLVQVGAQAMADRYTYIPLIGVFVAAVWGAAELGSRWERSGMIVPAATALLLAALTALTAWQVGWWRDSLTLMSRAVSVTDGNYIALTNLGSTLIDQGRHDEAIPRLQEALRIQPDHVNALYNLGASLLATGRYEEAVALFTRALQFTPRDADTYNNLGFSLYKLGRLPEAANHFRRALVLNPRHLQASANLADTLNRMGRGDEAGTLFAKPAGQAPDSRAQLHLRTGAVYLKQGDADKAIYHYREALRMMPDSREAREGLDRALALQAQGARNP